MAPCLRRGSMGFYGGAAAFLEIGRIRQRHTTITRAYVDTSACASSPPSVGQETMPPRQASKFKEEVVFHFHEADVRWRTGRSRWLLPFRYYLWFRTKSGTWWDHVVKTPHKEGTRKDKILMPFVISSDTQLGDHYHENLIVIMAICL